MPRTLQLACEGVLSVGDADLVYEVIGRGPPLVVLHGGPGLGCRYLRDPLSRLLADDYEQLFFDQRGSGRSTGIEVPEHLTMATLVDDLERVREAAGLERLHVLGHSFGGLLAMHYAIVYPDRVASLVLLDSDPASWAHWSRFRAVVAARTTEDDERALAEIHAVDGWASDPAAVESATKIGLRTYFAGRALADELDLGFDVRTLRNYQVTYARVREDLEQWDIYDALAGVTARTLIIHGAAGIFPLESAEALHARIPGSRLEVFEGAGHFPHMEAPERFNRTVVDFLGRP